MTSQKVHIHINLAAIRGLVTPAISRWVNLVSFGVHAGRTLTTLPEGFPDVFFQVQLGQQQQPLDVVRRDFEEWLIACGLRECVEVAAALLEEARMVLVLWSIDSRELTAGEWSELVADGARDFDRLTWPARFDWLEDQGLKLNLREQFLSINAARNCMVHRRGVVSERDVKTADSLDVKWRKVQLIAKKGEIEMPIEGPMVVEAGSEVCLRVSNEVKRFKRGEQISFTPQGFTEIYLTIHWMAQDIASQLEALGRSRGLAFAEQPAAGNILTGVDTSRGEGS